MQGRHTFKCCESTNWTRPTTYIFKNKHTLNILHAENVGKEGAVEKMRLMAGIHIDHWNFVIYTSFNVNSWNNKYGDVKNSVTQPMIYDYQAGTFTNHNNFKLREERRGYNDLYWPSFISFQCIIILYNSNYCSRNWDCSIEIDL